MSALRLDPRSNADRLYQYQEYQVIAARFAKRRPAPWYRRLLGKSFDEYRERRAPRPIRLLSYKIGLGSGMAVIIASVSLYAWLSAENSRLAYEQQEVQRSLASMEQARSDAAESNLSAQSQVLNGVNPETGVVYPEVTKYVVVTNIPEASGKTLVEELFPLSRRVIQSE
ncbi:hypothetical protein IT575_09105 [bacterium]|nr:hypothetical protein [bacterium]